MFNLPLLPKSVITGRWQAGGAARQIGSENCGNLARSRGRRCKVIAGIVDDSATVDLRDHGARHEFQVRLKDGVRIADCIRRQDFETVPRPQAISLAKRVDPNLKQRQVTRGKCTAPGLRTPPEDPAGRRLL